jgi:hypothetical protein
MLINASHLARTLLVASLCAASAMASAEIHRCKDDQGQTVLSDRPCGASTSVAPLESTKVGSSVDRLAAPDMHASHPQDGSQYDFIRQQNGRSERRSDKQAL